MTLLSSSSLLALILPPLLIVLAWIIAFRSIKDREKISPFECGFDPTRSARIPFSTRFFLLAVIFIVFDIEIVLLIPLPIMMMNPQISIIMITSTIFLIILIMGLIHEWNEGSLEWAK